MNTTRNHCRRCGKFINAKYQLCNYCTLVKILAMALRTWSK